MYISKRSGMNHTVLPTNTPCLPFLCKRSPDGGAPALTAVGAGLEKPRFKKSNFYVFRFF